MIQRLKVKYSSIHLIAVTIVLLFCLQGFSQTIIAGKILDAETKEPLMGVGVYLSGTSTGVVSGPDGKYSIDYDEVMKAPLVFSYLGYEKIQVANPIASELKIVLLKQQENELDAVVINPDPWSRATKEKLFLEYFLGEKSLEDCEILNLNDVRLRFNTDTKQLTAFSRKPIVIKNNHLGYLITYDLVEFEIDFKFRKWSINGIEKTFEIEHARSNYQPLSSFTSGSSFYQELEDKKPSQNKRERRREKAYKNSQLLLYRSFIKMNLRENKFDLYYNGFRVKQEDHMRVRKENNIFKVTFRNLKYSIKDRDDHQTDLILTTNYIFFDQFGNNLSPRELIRSGYISKLGVGGMMPLDFDAN